MPRDSRDVAEAMDELIHSVGWTILCEKFAPKARDCSSFLGIADLQELGKAQGRVEAHREWLNAPRRVLEDSAKTHGR